MIEVFVAGIGLRGPGMNDWPASVPVLTGQGEFVPEAPSLPPPSILAPNERRRAGTVVRLALAAAEEAVTMSGLKPNALRCVFGSANGDGALIHAILESVTEPDRHVSPTQFHNSVHNAPAGYWSIGAGSTQAASCLGCHDATVGAALLKAAAEARVEDQPVLLCAYDVPLPEPLGATRPTEHVFGAALVLLPAPHPSAFARLRIDWHAEPASKARVLPLLPDLWPIYSANPAARMLRLLESLARNGADALSIPLLDGRVDIELAPCSTDPAS